MIKLIIMKWESGFGFEDLLLLIGLKRLTGELAIESGNNIGSMTFEQGRILQASSPYSRAIGDILVDRGVITAEDLLKTLHDQKQMGLVPIGSMFVKAGKVDFETIEMMVHEQIRHAVRDFMSWKSPDVSVIEKDVMRIDSIDLPVYEFIPAESLKAAGSFCLADSAQADKAPPETAATPLT
jgi:hypothetical protein